MTLQIYIFVLQMLQFQAQLFIVSYKLHFNVTVFVPTTVGPLSALQAACASFFLLLSSSRVFFTLAPSVQVQVYTFLQEPKVTASNTVIKAGISFFIYMLGLMG
jgi:hypothetical protein